jgi:DNA-binding HxlR family transcriptional regulator
MREFTDSQLDCPVDFALQVLANRWTIAILRDLSLGTKRTSELVRSLSGISPRTLSERLRDLEEFGLITRKVYAEIPPRVEYALTQDGEEVRALLAEFRVLGQKWQTKLRRVASANAVCAHCHEQRPLTDCPVSDSANDESAAPPRRTERQSEYGAED